MEERYVSSGDDNAYNKFDPNIDPYTEWEQELDVADVTNDPVSMYLREIGGVGCLSSGDECALAHKIETCKQINVKSRSH